MRSVIAQYNSDKRRAPKSLDDLVSSGYLKSIPKDPMTRNADWIIDGEAVSQSAAKVVNVHSASSDKACDGSVYRDW